MAVNNQNDVTVNIGGDISDLKRKIQLARGQLKFLGTNVGNIKVDKSMQKLDASLDAVLGSGNMLKSQSKSFFKPIDDMVPKVTKSVKNFQGQILGAGLGIMFFGMVIQRVFTSIWNSASRTFTEVMASTEQSANGFTMLQGSLKYLWFVAGQALEPLAMALIPIIDKIAAWIEENPKLFAQIVKWGIIIGAALMILGQLGLGINGIVQALGLLKAAFLAIKGIKFAAIGKGLVSAFMSPITWIILLVAAIALVVVWIFKMKKEMGGWGEFFKSVLRGVLRFFVMFGEGIAWIGVQIVKGLLWIINKVIDGVNWLIQQSNKYLGTDIGELGNIKQTEYQFGDAFLRNYLDWEAEKLAPKNGYATGNEGDPKYSAPKEETKQVNIETVNIQTDNADQLLAELQRLAG